MLAASWPQRTFWRKPDQTHTCRQASHLIIRSVFDLILPTHPPQYVKKNQFLQVKASLSKPCCNMWNRFRRSRERVAAGNWWMQPLENVPSRCCLGEYKSYKWGLNWDNLDAGCANPTKTLVTLLLLLARMVDSGRSKRF